MIKRIAVSLQKRGCKSFLLTALIVSFGATSLVCYAQQAPQPPTIGPSSGGSVSGSIVVRVTERTAGTSSTTTTSEHLVFLPDFELFLQNVGSGELSEPVTTDLLGHFLFATQKAGTYHLRWSRQGGWQEGVYGRDIVITDRGANCGIVEIRPEEGGLLVPK